MRTIFLQPDPFSDDNTLSIIDPELDVGAPKVARRIDDNTLFIIDPDDGDSSQDRHLHFVFPATVCPDIEELCFYFENPYTVSFEPDSVSFPRLSRIGGQSESGGVLERLVEVIDAPRLTVIRLCGFEDIPASLFQKTTLKQIDLDSAVTPITIPDDIRNLVNLENFNLWRAKLDYLSPELFRLPSIRHISFYRVYGYEPTPEVIAAAEAFESAGGRLDSADEAGDIFPHHLRSSKPSPHEHPAK